MTRSSQERRTKRGIKAVSKKTAQGIAKGNGVDISHEVSMDPLVQGAKIGALEKAMERMVSMVQVNQGEIIKAFQLTDAHLWVLRQICQDIVSGTVMTVTLTPEQASSGVVPSVSLGSYYDLFNAKQRQDAEAATKAKQAEAPESVIVGTPDPEGPEIFGGDSHG